MEDCYDADLLWKNLRSYMAAVAAKIWSIQKCNWPEQLKPFNSQPQYYLVENERSTLVKAIKASDRSEQWSSTL